MSTVKDNPATVRSTLDVAAKWLADQGVDEARLGTEHLLAHVLGCRRLDLYLDHDRPLSEEQRATFRGLMRRRAAREPLAYILGTRGFYGLDLKVGPGVLVPRPETEHLVEGGLEELGRLIADGRSEPAFVDVGTGSGCVAFALLTNVPAAKGTGIDCSAAALAIAAENAKALGLTERLRLVQGDLLEGVEPGSVDLVVSNPPYITPDEVAALEPEVARHEPASALYDREGLPLTRRLIEQARKALRPGGALLIETGWSKGALVRGMFEAAGYADVRAINDLGGVERVIAGRVP